MRYELNQELRARLKKPLGELATEVPADATAVVGDVVSLEAVERMLKPKVMVYDYRTAREPIPEYMKRSISAHENGETVLVHNPAGTITEEANEAIRNAFSREGRTKIEVMGEEDLLVLPCVLHAPQGSKVCYGQPGQGVVIIESNEESKEMVRHIMHEMEVRK
ncbi:MAG: GTP-dependent dephospho-CoA kinase family protein [Candidatus Diapherotrites archaeon]|nr:GTP-dependent dephospho-CoA kinase family protein [Candidatus Diapherotrites archaeon]